MSERKKRRDMTDYEKALDWQNRLSPRLWRIVWFGFGLAGVLWVAGATLNLVSTQ